MVKVVLTGSVGRNTKPLAELLVQEGCNVAVITTNAARKEDIELIGAEALVGSIEDPAFLTTSFIDADVVFFVIPSSHSSPDSSRRVAENAVAAIQTAGVKKVIFLSSVGAHLPSGTGFILGSYHAEQVFRAVQGISLTIIRPGYYYYNLIRYIPMIKANVLGSNYGVGDRLELVHHNDVAEVVAEEVLAPAESAIKVRYVISDQRTCDEVASVLGAVINKPGLKWTVYTDQETEQKLAAAGLSTTAVAEAIEFGSALHSGALTADYGDTLAGVFGKTKLEDFARGEFAAAFTCA